MLDLVAAAQERGEEDVSISSCPSLCGSLPSPFSSVVMAKGSNHQIAGLMSDLPELLGQQYLSKADSRSIISSALLET